jgi:hypothetical protein
MNYLLLHILETREYHHNFLMGLLITFTSSERESAFLEPLLKKKQELGGPRFIDKACSLCKRLLGTSGVMQVKSKLRASKFSEMEE